MSSSVKPSNSLQEPKDDDDAMMVECLDVIENLGLCNYNDEVFDNKRKSSCLTEMIDSPEIIQLESNVCVPDIPAGTSKECYNNSSQTKRLKTTRMSQVITQGMTPIRSAFDGFCTEYFLKNFDSTILNSLYFLQTSKKQIEEVLIKALEYEPIKYNLKLESTYEIPKTLVIENRAFKTITRTLLLEHDLDEIIEEDFDQLLLEACDYESKGSGFSLMSIDGILININKYQPTFGSSYICLPDFIQNKGATINVMNNNDNKCFQYSILSKFIKSHPERLSLQYDALANKYDFSDLTFPVPLQHIAKFEKKT